MSSKTKHLIIFDFDGVLADTFDTFYMLIRDGLKSVDISLTPNQYRNLFIGNVHQGFKDFIRNNKKYELFTKFRTSNYDKYYYSKYRKVKLFPEAKTFLKKISKNYILTIASSGRKNNIKNLLEEKGLDNFFGLILANSSHSKEGMIKEILNKYQARPRQTFFITDTVGDIKVAKKVGLKTISVTWGFHNKKSIMTAKPDHIASDFKRLESILKNLK